MLFQPYFVDVLLPLPLERQFTYRITKEEYHFLKIGMRVAVPFGKSKIYTGIVYKLHEEEPQAYEAKDIYQILDDTPVLNTEQLKHWEWIATYYMCSLGEVLRAAFPSVFLLESETIVLANPNFEESDVLTPDAYLIYEALQRQSQLTIAQVVNILSKKNVFPILKNMIAIEAVHLKEEIYEQYQPKMVTYIRLATEWEAKEKLQELLALLSRSEKQRTLVMHYFMLKTKSPTPIKKKELLETSGISTSVCKGLENKGIFEAYEIQTDRIVFEEASQRIPTLSTHQQEAFHQIKACFSTHDVCLFHGVTGSGKTEVYAHLIKEVIATGKQVLFLVPEIALTTQLIIRLQKFFGDDLCVYHSKYSQNERAEVWNHILTGSEKAKIILGTRSATLLPFVNLGLVIVDEEHEASYKQFDPAPRYNARDAAIVLTKIHKATILLGSATPSLESYYNTKVGKYGLVTLTRRFGNVQMPKIQLIDIKEKHRKKQMTGHFSDLLLKEMKDVLDLGEQVILFQNRRGFAPLIECETCGVTPQCPNCDVSLTEHKFKQELRCHYCGYHRAIPKQCDACGSTDLNSKGFGTEQIEQELLALFPKHNIGRLDLDTTRGKYGYQKIIEAFQHQEIDILVGTQMLSKGLDFKNVSLVGVLNADNMLNFPDYRAHERSYQMLTQVSGRAGRSQKQGNVYIQTFNPYHQILQQVTTSSYEQMYGEQITDRRNFFYPPYYRIIQITLKHKDFNLLNEGAEWMGKSLKNSFGKNLLGPTAPSVSRVRNQYIKQLIVKIPPKQSVVATKDYLRKLRVMFEAIGRFRAIRINIDVDAY
ncbi:replication restart helicase PriA [Wenyingzhuangia aestuarii]|uniref:replication restart helicase PriA n=1 Tax=Wenyingzhuangia aestuarii TaxID=1647582 RepID=UPI001FD82AF3|nr:primosomal protein N' [Wenyingzhuangia aestuarii]NJB82644.1 primosomal protein N' (replication factor Y) [Wenyingzhuangia aestuarii]